MTDTSTSPAPSPRRRERPVRIAVIGAGFSGIAMALALQKAGMDDDLVIIDAADDFGGTWRDNVYPGCACDVPSHLYSLEGEPYDWPRLYSHQPVIQRYILDVVERRGLRRHARLGVAVTRQTWDDATASWTVELADGSAVEADVVVNCLGPLRKPVLPAIPGRETFAGPAFHTAEWDTSVDLTGKRVGVIGTGASAVQVIPEIVDEVAHLTVFQRTPSWVLPRAERTFSPLERAVLRRVPAAQAVLRHGVNAIVEHLVWRVLAQGEAAQARAIRMGRWNIHRGIADPALREAVTPTLKPGCKRIMFSNTYYPALARDHVDVETGSITGITPTGVVVGGDREVPLDVLVHGTGFDPHRFWQPIQVVGQDGADLDERWADGGIAHAGTSAPGFPNLFFLLGPNTGTGHNSVVLMAEAQARYVVGALRYLRSGAADWLAVTDRAAEAFAAEVAQRHERLVWASGCGSWYLNEAGVNDTIYPGPVRDFQRRLAHFDVGSYRTGHRSDVREAAPAAV